jgi:hypothetical protein
MNYKLNYDAVHVLSEGFARVKLNDRYGFIDETGAEVIPSIYDDAEDFSEGLARVQLSSEYESLDDGYVFDHTGLVCIGLNGKYGFIDKTGAEVIPLTYDNVMWFQEGLIRVQLNGEWRFINKTGKEVTLESYEKVNGRRKTK